MSTGTGYWPQAPAPNYGLSPSYYAPQLPPATDPYTLAGQMAYSNMMNATQNWRGGALSGFDAYTKLMGSMPGAGPDPNLASWMPKGTAQYQQGDPNYSRIMGTGQRLIDAYSNAGTGGDYSASLKADMMSAAQTKANQAYNSYTDRMQELAMQQAMANQQAQTDLEGKVVNALQQQAQMGIPASQSRMGLDAILAAQGNRMPGAQQDLYASFNALYPGGGEGTGSRISPLGSITLLDAQTNPGAPIVYQAVLQEMAKEGSNPNVVMQNLLTQAQTDDALAQALAKPGTLQAVTQYAYSQQAQSQGGAGAAATLPGAPPEAQPQENITDYDKYLSGGEDALKYGALGAGIGTAIMPGLGTIVGGAFGTAGGLLHALFSPHEQSQPGAGNTPATAVSNLFTQGAVPGAVNYGLGQLGAGGGLPFVGGKLVAPAATAGARTAAASGLGKLLPGAEAIALRGLSSTPTAGAAMFGLPGLARRGLGNIGEGLLAKDAAAAASRMTPFGGLMGPNGYTPGYAAEPGLGDLAAARSGVPGAATAGAPGAGVPPSPGVGASAPGLGTEYTAARYAGPVDPYYPYSQSYTQPYANPLGPLPPLSSVGAAPAQAGGGLSGLVEQSVAGATGALAPQAMALAPLQAEIQANLPGIWEMAMQNTIPPQEFEQLLAILSLG